MILPPIDNDSDEEVNVDEDDVREIRQHLDKLHSSSEDNLRDKPVSRDSIQFYSMEESGETDLMSEVSMTEEVCMEEPWNELPQMANDSMEDNFVSAADTLTASGPATRSIQLAHAVSPHSSKIHHCLNPQKLEIYKGKA